MFKRLIDYGYYRYTLVEDRLYRWWRALRKGLHRKASQGPAIYYDDAGKIVPIFTLPPTTAPGMESVLLFSLPKAGSVLLHNIMKDICDEVGIPYVALMSEIFDMGLNEDMLPPSTRSIFLDKGYCYGGFRYIPESLEIPIVGRVKSLLLVRDPRDLLVSNYFSSAFSHPQQGTVLATSRPDTESRQSAAVSTIDDYVLNIAGHYKSMYARYFGLMKLDQKMAIYRYEDIIYRKVEWIQDVLNYFGWRIRERRLKYIVNCYELIPDSERSSEHIRQVHPGNFRIKLAPDTIAKLNEIFAFELAALGYDPFVPSESMQWVVPKEMIIYRNETAV